MVYLIVAVISLVAGTIQAITGFGSGIVCMLFFPNFFPMDIAPSVAELIGCPLTAGISFRYRKSIDFKHLLIPVLSFMAGSILAIRIVSIANLNLLKAFFGLFLSFLGIFNLKFQNSIRYF